MVVELKNHPLYRFKDFRKLFIARLISAIGDKFFTISIAWFVVSQGGESSKIELGILMAINILPIVIFGPLMGSLADKLNRKFCLIISDVIRAVLMAALAFLVWSGSYNVIYLYLICFLAASFTPLFESAVNSSIVDLTDEENTSKAVAIDAMTMHISSILGALAGGVFIAFFGAVFTFAFNSLSFLISMVIILFIKKNLNPKKEVTAGYKNEVKEGFQYIASEKGILWLLAVFTVFNFFASPLLLMIPMIVKFSLKLNVEWVAIFEAVLSVGSVLISLILGFYSIKNKFYFKIFIGMFFLGLSTLSIGLVANKYAISAFMFIVGAGLSFVNAAAFTIFQNKVPDYIKGRFFAILTTACYSVMPLAYIATAFLTQRYSLDFLLIVQGSASVIVAFLICFIPKVHMDKGI